MAKSAYSGTQIVQAVTAYADTNFKRSSVTFNVAAGEAPDKWVATGTGSDSALGKYKYTYNTALQFENNTPITVIAKVGNVIWPDITYNIASDNASDKITIYSNSALAISVIIYGSVAG